MGRRFPRAVGKEIGVEPGEGVGKGGEGAFELGVVGGFKDGFEMGAGFPAAFEEVAAEDEGRGGGVFDLEAAGGVAEPVEGGEGSAGERGAAGVVGGGEAEEAVDAADFAGEAADGGVAGAGFVKGVGFEVVENEDDDLFDEVLLAGEAFEEGAGGHFALLFVAEGADVAVAVFSGGGFAEVVAEDGEADHEVFAGIAEAFAGEGVEAVEGVDPDVAFGVPFGVLGAADEGVEFGVMADPAGVVQKAEAGGKGAALEEEFFPLLEKALGGQALGLDGAAEGDGGGVGGELKTGDKLHAAEDAEGVLAEAGAAMAEETGGEVGLAAEGVVEGSGKGVPKNGVDGEIAAQGGLGAGQKGVAGDGETFVAKAAFRFAAGEADIDRLTLDFEDPKGAAYFVDRPALAQDALEVVGGEAIHFHVQVFDRQAEEGVADGPADDPGLAAGLLEPEGQLAAAVENGGIEGREQIRAGGGVREGRHNAG